MKHTKPAASYQAALYMRLSKDDEGVLESASIATQRKMLRAYAQEQGYQIYGEYVDDGYSGTNFDRPGWQRMIADIESKKVNLVLTKDLSRLGRDYIQAGQYTELYFPEKGVRYIAINDGYDSQHSDTDIAPFKNVINELYARDISKKIRSAFLTRMREGAFIGNFAPYGYQKDPDDKHHLIVDPNTAPIVRQIFQMAARGRMPAEIAQDLNNRQVPPPAVYRCQRHAHLDITQYSQSQTWTSSTVSHLFRNVVYLGHMAQGKTTKLSFKSRATITNPKDDWIFVPNTHEPIVDAETFDLVQRRSLARTCRKKGAFYNVFSGLAKCADCGHNMSTVGTRKKGSPADLACGGYKLHGKERCSNHFIDYTVLYRIVLEELRAQLQFQEQQVLVEALHQRQCQTKHSLGREKEWERQKRRERELDQAIAALYSDYQKGMFQEARFRKLLLNYEVEANQVREAISALKQERGQANEAAFSLAEAEAMVSKYMHIEQLNPDLLFHLLDRVEVCQGTYTKIQGVQVKRQTVRLYFRFAGVDETKQAVF